MKKHLGPMVILFTTVLMDLVGFGIVIPLIALYGREFGASALELAVLGGAYSACQFLFSPYWGALSDRVGRRPVLLFSLWGSAISYAVFALSKSYEVLLLSRVFAGVFAANIPVAQAYVADITGPEERLKGMGMIGAAFGIGFTIGPALGGIAAHFWGLSAPGWLACAICSLNALLAIRRLPESLKTKSQGIRRNRFQELQSLFPSGLSSANSSLVIALILAFVFTFAFSNMEQTLSIFLQSRFDWEVGITGFRTGMLLMFSGLIGAFTQGWLVKRYGARFGERTLLIQGFVLYAMGMVLFAIAPHYAYYFLFALPASVGSGLAQPAITALISKNTSPEEQGRALGVQQSLSSLARVLGPMSGLSLFALWKPAPLIFASALSILSAILVGNKISERARSNEPK